MTPYASVSSIYNCIGLLTKDNGNGGCVSTEENEGASFDVLDISVAAANGPTGGMFIVPLREDCVWDIRWTFPDVSSTEGLRLRFIFNGNEGWNDVHP